MKRIFLITLLSVGTLYSDNQTDILTPVLVNKPLPFTITIASAGFTLPEGIQSAAMAQLGDEFLLIAGRTNGLHDFNNDDNNFPPNKQNTTIFVINPYTKTIKTRSLHDPLSGLTQQQIDSLSVTAPQFYQRGNTLYITGGYGVDTATGNFSTKDTLTAINVLGLIFWVKHPQSTLLASQYIRQISHPTFQVTGGYMFQVNNNPTLLVFGQNFNGFYLPGSNGNYTEQVRRFHIIDDNKSLKVDIKTPTVPDPNYRRRDLNIVPIIKVAPDKTKTPAFVALSGVFTPTGGMWTTPVDIAVDGTTSMANPSLATTFKQGMNNYICPHVELLSKTGSMYIVLFGGITFEYFQNGQLVTDAELPFTNQVTVIERNTSGHYKQYLVPTQYPLMISKASNPGNQLLFGASGRFIPARGVPTYDNGVLNLEKIKKPLVIGHIVGGIQSTVPNTSTSSDSAASPYIFKVILSPHY